MKIPRNHLLSIIVVLVAHCVSATTFSLEFLTAEAERHSTRLQSINRQLEHAELSIQVLYSSWFPRISFDMGIDHYFAHDIPYQFRVDEATGIPLVGEGVGDLSDIVELPTNTFSMALSLTQPVFMQGRTRPQMRAARAEQRTLLCSLEEEKDRIRCETTKMYYRVMLQQERLLLSRDHLMLAEEAHRLARLNFTSGRGREIDTLSTLLRIEEARIDGKLAERDYRASAQALITLCGFSGSASEFRVDGSFPEPIFFMTIDEAIDQLYRGNHRIIQFQGNETILNERITLAKEGYLPTVFGGAALGRLGRFPSLSRPGDLRWNNDQRVYIALSWNLFSGLSQQKIITQRRIERDTLLLAQQGVVRELERATRDAFDKVSAAIERLTMLETIVEIAHKRYAMAKNACAVGNATSVELQNAEVEFGRARLLKTEGLYEFHCALADFKFLIGYR
jgi:outer membrane protein TolC